MADEYDSDEDKYANESFETESETDNIPEHVDAESSEDELPANRLGNNSNATMYTKMFNPKNANNNGNSIYRHRRDYSAYHSSSDDENDVIISETIAEINTVPMRLEDADIMTQKPVELQHPSSIAKSTSDQSSEDESDEESDEENEDEESDSNNENANSDTVIEQTAKRMAAESSSSCNEDSENEDSDNNDKYDDEDNTSDANASDDINDTDAKSECINECKTDVVADVLPNADHVPIANINYAECKEVASQLTFTQSISRTKCGIDCNDCIETETVEVEETEIEATSDTNLNDFNTCKPTVEVHLTSQTPTSFNSDDYTFHMNLIPHGVSNSTTRLKAAHRKSWSFTNERMREIERQNQILLKKILTQKPTYCLNPPKKSINNNSNKFTTASASNNRITSAAVNRKKQQRQIDLDNQVLKRKIEAISLRRPLL